MANHNWLTILEKQSDDVSITELREQLIDATDNKEPAALLNFTAKIMGVDTPDLNDPATLENYLAARADADAAYRQAKIAFQSQLNAAATQNAIVEWLSTIIENALPYAMVDELETENPRIIQALTRLNNGVITLSDKETGGVNFVINVPPPNGKRKRRPNGQLKPATTTYGDFAHPKARAKVATIVIRGVDNLPADFRERMLLDTEPYGFSGNKVGVGVAQSFIERFAVELGVADTIAKGVTMANGGIYHITNGKPYIRYGYPEYSCPDYAIASILVKMGATAVTYYNDEGYPIVHTELIDGFAITDPRTGGTHGFRRQLPRKLSIDGWNNAAEREPFAMITAPNWQHHPLLAMPITGDC